MGMSLQDWANLATTLGGFAAVFGVLGGAKFLLDYRIEERRIREAREFETARTLEQQKYDTIRSIRSTLSEAYRDIIAFRAQYVERMLSLQPSEVQAFEPTMNYLHINTANSLRTIREMAAMVKRENISDLNAEISEHLKFVSQIVDEDVELSDFYQSRLGKITRFVEASRKAGTPILSPAELDKHYYASDPAYALERFNLTALAHLAGAQAVQAIAAQLKQLEPYFKAG